MGWLILGSSLQGAMWRTPATAWGCAPSALPSKKPSPRGTPASRPWPSPGEGAPSAGMVRDRMGGQQENPWCSSGAASAAAAPDFGEGKEVFAWYFWRNWGLICCGSVVIWA